MSRATDGGQRLDDADDFVRREIALALEQGKKVIPSCSMTPPFPRATVCLSAEALVSIDALTLRGKTYEYPIERRELVRLLAKVPGRPRAAGRSGRNRCRWHPPDTPRASSKRNQPLCSISTKRSRRRSTGSKSSSASTRPSSDALPDHRRGAGATRTATGAAGRNRGAVPAIAGPGRGTAGGRARRGAAQERGAGGARYWPLQQADDLLVKVEVAQDAALDPAALEREPSDSKSIGRRPRRSVAASR